MVPLFLFLFSLFLFAGNTMIGINSFTPHPCLGQVETEPPSRWAVGPPPGRRITFDPWSGGAHNSREDSVSRLLRRGFVPTRAHLGRVRRPWKS
ncbi:hypothetical protein HDV63DRAFT_128952 [Trichoderma sp. SZMC 28014]